ncbi:tyrosine-type recombinase/integrase [Kineococcus sp. SYSU DK005]|uniref:tyrosine-type recombinase/integrase n=1 Tax=Kineococcus sp. SYSU DK005 TaxID=3383126 RepID=UPI003D7E533D
MTEAALPIPEDSQAAAELERRLTAAVRPELRVSVLPCEGPGFYPSIRICRIEGCDRQSHAHGLCATHRMRWRYQGCPEDVEAWSAATPTAMQGLRPVRNCEVEGCLFGVEGSGLCGGHSRRWKLAGKPELATWRTTQEPFHDRQAHAATCRMPWCDRRVHGRQPFCKAHYARWNDAGKPPVEQLINQALHTYAPRLDLSQLQPTMRTQVQYALQHRIDTGRFETSPRPLKSGIDFLAQLGATSMLERSFEQWDELVGQYRMNDSSRAFTRQMFHLVDAVAAGDGWSGQYDRDVWDMQVLLGSRAHRVRFLRFTPISQPWLRELSKRYIRWRLSVEISLPQLSRDLIALSLFSAALRQAQPEPSGLAELRRSHLELYLASLRLHYETPQTRSGAVGCLATFLATLQHQQWDDSLSAQVQFYREDYPRRPHREPRRIAEFVMAQVEHEDNLSRWHDPADRLITEIMIRTGRRIGEAVGLRTSCLLRDGVSGEPYLRYYNAKMKREAFAPVDDQLAQAIDAQIARVRQIWPDGERALFPKDKNNPTGERVVPDGTFRRRLYLWLERCDVRDEHGAPIRFTPHQWRHTFATRLVEANVPIEVVRRLLDHETIQMMGHYARVGMQRARQEWERARKVNSAGEVVRLDPAEELSEAAYASHALSKPGTPCPTGTAAWPRAPLASTLTRACPAPCSSPPRSSCPSTISSAPSFNCRSSTTAPTSASGPRRRTGKTSLRSSASLAPSKRPALPMPTGKHTLARRIDARRQQPLLARRGSAATSRSAEQGSGCAEQAAR